ncbi:MAG: transcription termination/antitermination protein NusG [Candidatus Binatia bacterium]
MENYKVQTAERQWYVVYSKPQKEDYATFHLHSKGLEVFFPRLLLPETSRTRRRVVPLFPNYLFVKLNLLSDEYYWASWSPGVSRIVNFNGHAAAIEDQVINVLKQRSGEEGIIPARSNLQCGQEVRISGGPLEGILGIIQQPPSARGRVKILLNLLNRQMNVEMPVHLVNGSWVASDLGPSVTQ